MNDRNLTRIFRREDLRFFGGLLLLVVGLFFALSMLGCGGGGGGCGGSTSSNSVDRGMDLLFTARSEPDVLNPQATYQKGDRLELTLKGYLPGGDPGKFIWTPPAGAVNFQFPGRQPDPGGPPFVFSGLTPAQIAAGFNVSYEVSEAIINEGSGYFSDSLSIQQGQNQISSQIHHFTGSKLAAAAEPLHTLPARAITRPLVSDIWYVNHYTDVESNLTTQGCEDLVAQGQSANTFMAWRLPVTSTTLPNQPYTVPVLTQETNSPYMILEMYGSGNVAMPLEVRATASEWANQNLPAAPGEMWVALGVQPDAQVTCPAGLNLNAYSLKAEIQLDLTNLPDQCAGCTLEFYGCYKTEAMPAALRAAAALAPNSLTAGGFTCLGEDMVLNMGNWAYDDNTESLLLKPGDPIYIHYFVFNWGSDPITLNLAPAPTLPGAAWVIRPGQAADPWQPDMGAVVGSTVTVPGNGQFHFHIFSTTPADTPAGGYEYELTLSGTGIDPASMSGSSLLLVSADGSLPDPIPPDPAVGLSGSAGSPTVAPGGSITYTLLIRNTGAVELTNLVLTDPIPAGTAFQSCGGLDSCAQAAGTVSWNLAHLGTGQTASASLTVQVTAGAGATITNTGYHVSSGQSVSADGAAIQVTVGAAAPRKIFIPVVRR